MSATEPVQFGEGARFEVRGRLGGGGFGGVYEVFDAERGEVVALKVLEGHSPHALAMFKREFRSLADLRTRVTMSASRGRPMPWKRSAPASVS